MRVSRAVRVFACGAVGKMSSFDKLEQLEANGFFSATWLVWNSENGFGLWPDVDGNRPYDDGDAFVVWIGAHLEQFVLIGYGSETDTLVIGIRDGDNDS